MFFKIFSAEITPEEKKKTEKVQRTKTNQEAKTLHI